MTQREAVYIDGNFGVWDIKSEEDIELGIDVERCSPEDYEQLTNYDDEYYEEEDEEDDGDEWEDDDDEWEDE